MWRNVYGLGEEAGTLVSLREALGVFSSERVWSSQSGCCEGGIRQARIKVKRFSGTAGLRSYSDWLDYRLAKKHEQSRCGGGRFIYESIVTSKNRTTVMARLRYPVLASETCRDLVA